MKIAYIIIRSLLGLILLLSSVSYFYLAATHKMPPQTGQAQVYLAGINLVNLMNLAKVIELICGLLFVTGRLNALAVIVIFPILINILLFHLYLSPEGIPVSVAMLCCAMFIGFYFRPKYIPLFDAD